MDDYLLKIKRLAVNVNKKRFQIENIIKNININIKIGQKIGIVGESGSGKTITALSIMKLLRSNMFISEGEIIFKNQNLLKFNDKKINNIRGREISIIFQDPMNSLNPLIKIGNQISEVAKMHLDMSTQKAKNLALEIMIRLGFTDPEYIYNQYPHQLSGGMKQRILISSAIICNPSFLIADEPTTALDVTIQKQIINFINEINIKSKMAVMFISHDLAVLNLVVDYIYVMYKGYILEYGNKDDIIKKPHHPYTMSLIKNMITNKSKNENKILYVNNNTYVKGMCPFLNRCKFAFKTCYNDFPTYVEVNKNHFSMCFNDIYK